MSFPRWAWLSVRRGWGATFATCRTCGTKLELGKNLGLPFHPVAFAIAIVATFTIMYLIPVTGMAYKLIFVPIALGLAAGAEYPLARWKLLGPATEALPEARAVDSRQDRGE